MSVVAVVSVRVVAHVQLANLQLPDISACIASNVLITIALTLTLQLRFVHHGGDVCDNVQKIYKPDILLLLFRIHRCAKDIVLHQ